jgi:hypothetical protein
MKNKFSYWLRNHFHKFIDILLLIIILILGVNYSSLKKENTNIIKTAAQQQNQQQATIIQQQPVIVETSKIDEEANFPDAIPPKIESYCLSALKKNEERVCIKIDSWNGYLDSVNSVPVTGKIEGNVKSITVDGKKVTWDENEEIYQRLNLYIYGGLNKYKVVAEDMNGNKSSGYIETDAQNNNNNLNVNLNE